MRKTSQIAAVTMVLIFCVGAYVGGEGPFAWSQAAEPETFFHDFVGLNDQQIRDIRAGTAIAKVLESATPDEVFVFGAVYVNSTPERYLTLAADLDALRKLPNYMALRKFSVPPQVSDLDGFTLTEGEIKDLQRCTPGNCVVQVPASAIEDFQRSVNWSAPDRVEQANRLAQQLALQLVLKYQQGGNPALGTYRDKDTHAPVAETFASLLGEMKALPVYLPQLQHYLLDYPHATSDGITSEFYWEKVQFGLKPTLRIVQAIIFRGTSPGTPAYAVAVKQLYASHYFDTALDLTVCVKGATKDGFYLITIKGSRQAGLTGVKGSIVRKIAVDKTRSSLQRALAAYKQKLEG